ncbi:tetratricopeptide repeat protein [Alloscardovia venturai]|uniref:Tetratricopeptide repeat protein n=1 Tax=Alloscardovia venturai TaxID=1769421 RepID=A0ABW2Y9K8_9BIFI
MSTQLSAQSQSALEQVRSVFHWAVEERKISALVARKVVKTLTIDGHAWQVGWVHDPLRMTRHRCALGIFPTKKTFIPVAVADSHARIYEVGQWDADVVDIEPRVQIVGEGEGEVHSYRFLRTVARESTSEIISVSHGAVVARSEDGRLRWLSSWLRSGENYTFEQVRSLAVSPTETANLSYRDAMVLAYFVMYVQPTLALHGKVFGFGTSNIYRRLRNQAPLSAIRTSVADIEAARAQGLKVSGLEEYFTHTMHESGALSRIPQLEAKHGQENLELLSNAKSHLYYLHSRNGVDFDAALKTLRIEANLNRFSAVSSVVENNYHYDFTPTEDFISLPYVAHLATALLENPAFDALSTLETNGVMDSDAHPALRYPVNEVSTSQESSFASQWLGQFYAAARKSGKTRLDDVASINAVYPMVAAARDTAAHKLHENEPYDDDVHMDASRGAGKSEWLYRQTMAELITTLRLPLRSDIDFRSNLSGDTGCVAISYTSTASSVMPQQRYDSQQLAWVDLSEQARKRMASKYDLRVGIMLAALAFGASSDVSEVAVCIDSLGSAEDIEDRDPTIYALLMRAFEHMGIDPENVGGTQTQPKDTQPKDGDVHGDPSPGVAFAGLETSAETNVDDTFMNLMKSIDFSPEQVDAFTQAAQSLASADGELSSSLHADSTEKHDKGPSDEEVDAVFHEVIHQHDGQSSPDTATSDNSENTAARGVRVMSGPGSDPLDLIRRTALSNTVATVVFEREKFLNLISRYGLTDPVTIYRSFDSCVLDMDPYGVLQPVNSSLDIRDARYTAQGSLEEPELNDRKITSSAAAQLGIHSVRDLSIQRSDILEGAQADIVTLSRYDSLSVPQRAERISQYIDHIADPELDDFKEAYIRNVIDGKPIDRVRFTLSTQFDADMQKARDMFMHGDVLGSFEYGESRIETLDDAFKAGDRVPVYFNSYAERVVYNRQFATPGEKLVLIPDNLFQAHMELVEVYSHTNQQSKALQHLNTAVGYAPTYALPHLRLAILLAEQGDWQSSFAAASNGLRVALDKDDAAYAYYRMAYAQWMQDEFELAAACYVMAIRISAATVPGAPKELEELAERARSQDIPLPLDYNEAVDALTYYDIDLWPHSTAASMMDMSAKAAVDNYLFVAGRTLTVAAARIASAAAAMEDGDEASSDIAQFQFLRSLNA